MRRKKPRILVVDETKALASITKSILEVRGFECLATGVEDILREDINSPEADVVVVGEIEEMDASSLQAEYGQQVKYFFADDFYRPEEGYLQKETEGWASQ